MAKSGTAPSGKDKNNGSTADSAPATSADSPTPVVTTEAAAPVDAASTTTEPVVQAEESVPTPVTQEPVSSQPDALTTESTLLALSGGELPQPPASSGAAPGDVPLTDLPAADSSSTDTTTSTVAAAASATSDVGDGEPAVDPVATDTPVTIPVGGEAPLDLSGAEIGTSTPATPPPPPTVMAEGSMDAGAIDGALTDAAAPVTEPAPSEADGVVYDASSAAPESSQIGSATGTETTATDPGTVVDALPPDTSMDAASGGGGGGGGDSVDSTPVAAYTVTAPIPSIATTTTGAPIYVYSGYQAWAPAYQAGMDAHYTTLTSPDAGNVAAQALLADDSGIVLQGNALLSAAATSAALYDGTSTDLGIGHGLVMTSGTLGGFYNTSAGYGVDNGRAGDAALNQVVNTVFTTASYDASFLEFSFTLAEGVDANSVSFDIVFGSDEFPEWVDSYVDTAAVWVNGTNYAMFNHDQLSPLSVVHQNVNAGYFINNTDGHLGTEYDGVSRLLRITAPIEAGATNTIRIAIADTGDHILDSAIYVANLKAGTSYGSGVTAIDHQGSSGNDDAQGTEKAESFDLSDGDDSVNAGLGDDIIDGGYGNDYLVGDAGDDAMQGGDGDDSARYHGDRAQFLVVHDASNNTYVVTDLLGTDGTDILSGVEKLHFDDGTFTIESLVDGATPVEILNGAPLPSGTTSPAAEVTAQDIPAPTEAQPPAETTQPIETPTPIDAAAPVDAPQPVEGSAPADPAPALDAGAGDQPAPGADLTTDAAADQAAAEAAAQAAAEAAAQAAAEAAAQAAAEAAAQAAAEAAAEAAAQAAAEAQAAAAQAAAAAEEAAAQAAAELAKLMAGLTVSGTAGDDVLYGNLGGDTLDGGLGADMMFGGAGDDIYMVDDRKDVVVEAAGEGVDTIYSSADHTLAAHAELLYLTGTGSANGFGNGLDNLLVGNSGKNVLNGGQGHDTLQGGGGIDQLIGGGGSDLFVFDAVSDSDLGKKHDVITDFGSDDFIDLSGIDANSSTAGDDAFSYIGTSDFSKVAGQLHFDPVTGNLSGDVNGDGQADFEINLAGVNAAPSASSFYL